MNKLRNGLRLSVLPVLLSLVAQTAGAATLFERDLPILNINNAAGAANRSNYGLQQNSQYIIGSVFDISTAGLFRVDTLTFYLVGNAFGENLSSVFSAINLYGGISDSTSPSPTNPIDLVSLKANTYSASAVAYPGGAQYQTVGNYETTNGFLPIYAITFSNLNWVVNGGQEYFFAVQGISNSGAPFTVHASTASKSGGIQQYNLDYILLFGYNPSFNSLQYQSSFPAIDTVPVYDVNVVITGASVPEPGTWMLSAGGLLIAGLRSRKRRV